VFLDNGVSGKGLHRPALDELRDVIRTERLEAVLMYAPDRLARSYPHQLILLEEFRKYGVKVCFLKGAPEGNTPEAVMFNHFQGIFAEYERALILDRSRRGRLYKAKQGDPSVLPDVPFGYRKIRNDRHVFVEVVEKEAAVVKLIFRLYVHEGLSSSAICRYLKENGILTSKGNANWDKATIRDMLRNPAYIGSACYGKTERSEGVSNKIRHHSKGTYIKAKYARIKLPEEKWLSISIPAIVSENDFQLVQEQGIKNKALSSRNTKEPSLLQGLVMCGECGYPFYKRFRKTQNAGYYFCRSHNDSKLTKCSNGSVRQKELDDLVYNEILQLLQNPLIIREELERRAKESKNVDEAIQQENACRKELQKHMQERDRLLDAYQNGLLDLKELSQRNQKLDKRRGEIEREIKGLHALKLTQQLGNNWEQVFDTILERIKKSATELAFPEKQQLIRLLVERVVVSRDTVKIMHCISPQLLSGEKVPLRLGVDKRPNGLENFTLNCKATTSYRSLA
jgi:site-specific DNA recombinase